MSQLLLLTQVTTSLPEMREQADLLVQMAEEAELLIARLASMKDVQVHLDNIDRLESEGDAVYRRILARLYSGELEALEVLRWKGIVEALEGALNTIEDISDVVESIVLKHATDRRPRPMETFALVVVVLVALGFDFVNGFHDAANSIATVVSTRVLTPRQAVIWAAAFNFIAFLVFGTHVADTIAKDVVDAGACCRSA